MARLKGTKSKTKAKRTRKEVRTLVPTRIDEKNRHRQRSMRLNNIFDNFRRDIEDVMNPWSSMLDWGPIGDYLITN
jgi:Mg2+/Co2+ transporter CorB